MYRFVIMCLNTVLLSGVSEERITPFVDETQLPAADTSMCIVHVATSVLRILLNN